jgi:PAS domain S-box-containing protein
MVQSIDKFKQTFRENLKQLRKDRDLTQIELSEKSGFEASYVGKLERGGADPSLESIRKICGTLDIEPEELLLPPGAADDVDAERDVYEAELKMQNEELNRIEAKLREARDRYHQLYDRAPVPFATVDENGLLQETNQAFRDHYLMGESALEGDHINSLVHEDDRDDFYRYRERVMQEEDPDPILVRFRTSDEVTHHCRVTSRILQDLENEPLLLIALYDVTGMVES